MNTSRKKKHRLIFKLYVKINTKVFQIAELPVQLRGGGAHLSLRSVKCGCQLSYSLPLFAAISESSKRSKVLIGTSTPNEIEEKAQRLRKKRIVTGRGSKDRENYACIIFHAQIGHLNSCAILRISSLIRSQSLFSYFNYSLIVQ